MIIYRFICLIYCAFFATVAEGVTLSNAVKHRSFINSLTDYTCPGGIKAAIVDLFQAQLGVEIQKEAIVNLEHLALNGKSQDRVYYIYNDKQERIYVVKAFQEPKEPRSHFLSELRAMAFLQRGRFQHVHTAEPLAFGQCYQKGVPYALLVESVARGKRLMDYIEVAGRKAKGSFARESALEKLKQAMAGAGKGFGELVQKSSLRKGSFPVAFIRNLETRLDKFLKNPIAENYKKLLSSKRVKKYIRNLCDRIQKPEHHFVYSHGDAHARNCFYDRETDIFTLIDLGHMPESIDAKGLPRGHEGYDFMRFLDDACAKSVGLLSAQEIQYALQAFIDHYEQVAGRLPSPVNQEFFCVYRLVTRLEQYADYTSILDSDKRKERREIFLHAAKKLSTMMQK